MNDKKMRSFVAIDIETTGFKHEGGSDEIIEIGIVKCDGD